MKNSRSVFTVLILAIMLFSGCAGSKNIEPKIIYKDVFVPIRCNAIMPLKPNNDGSFKAHKELMIYYIKTEELLKQCINYKDDKGVSDE